MRIGAILKKWRAMSDIDLRAAGLQMGISASALLRIEKGRVPDGETLVKLQAWLFGSDAVPEPEVESGELTAS